MLFLPTTFKSGCRLSKMVPSSILLLMNSLTYSRKPFRINWLFVILVISPLRRINFFISWSFIIESISALSKFIFSSFTPTSSQSLWKTPLSFGHLDMLVGLCTPKCYCNSEILPLISSLIASGSFTGLSRMLRFPTNFLAILLSLSTSSYFLLASINCLIY